MTNMFIYIVNNLEYVGNIIFKMFQNRFDEFYLTICKEVGGI